MRISLFKISYDFIGPSINFDVLEYGSVSLFGVEWWYEAIDEYSLLPALEFRLLFKWKMGYSFGRRKFFFTNQISY